MNLKHPCRKIRCLTAASIRSEPLFEGEADFVAAPPAIPDGVEPVAVADDPIRAPQGLEADAGADSGEAAPANGRAGRCVELLQRRVIAIEVAGEMMRRDDGECKVKIRDGKALGEQLARVVAVKRVGEGIDADHVAAQFPGAELVDMSAEPPVSAHDDQSPAGRNSSSKRSGEPIASAPGRECHAVRPEGMESGALVGIGLEIQLEAASRSETRLDAPDAKLSHKLLSAEVVRTGEAKRVAGVAKGGAADRVRGADIDRQWR